jgi:hypothetical protein
VASTARSHICVHPRFRWSQGCDEAFCHHQEANIGFMAFPGEAVHGAFASLNNPFERPAIAILYRVPAAVVVAFLKWVKSHVHYSYC